MLYDLVGFTGSGLSHANWKPFGDNVPERAARLVHERKMGPAIIVFPDCFTALGGNQYVNSSALGDYADYLTREIVPFVDREFRTLPSREHRGCFGKSSGGYGAIVHGMKYARSWGAVANHSGDAYFDFVYWCDWPNTLNELTKHRAAETPARRRTTRSGIRPARPVRRARRRAHPALPRSRVEEGKALDGRRPLHHEPLHGGHLRPGSAGAARLPRSVQSRNRGSHRAALVQVARARPYQPRRPLPRAISVALRGIYIDCGWRDQYQIHYGTRILSKRLAAAGIRHTYEEFDDNHSDIDYRMDTSLPFLYRALKP